jgi:FkbM family methyltransferase
MPFLQDIVRGARRVLPRGWAPLLQTSARVFPNLQSYRARTDGDDFLYIDLRQSMCLTIFFHQGQPHEQGTEALLRHVLKTGDTFVDVGANVGFYARMASVLVGESGRVFAFEPLSSALRLSKMNTESLTNVVVDARALSDHNGEADFHVRYQGDTSSLLPGDAGSRVRVGVTTLDARLLSEGVAPTRVDFIKIDVEGAELSVLRGATKTIEKYQPLVYFEFLPLYASQYGFGYDDFAGFFEPLGYSLHWINHDANGPELFSATESTYLAAIPPCRSGLLHQN